MLVSRSVVPLHRTICHLLCGHLVAEHAHEERWKRILWTPLDTNEHHLVALRRLSVTLALSTTLCIYLLTYLLMGQLMRCWWSVVSCCLRQ